MTLLGIFGDLFWILALSVMASAANMARKRVPKGATLPFRGMELPRTPALLGPIVLAFVIGSALMLAGRTQTGLTAGTVIVFGLKATLAPLLALGHLVWLKSALDRLDDRGTLLPMPGPKLGA
jgi:hypothetical protein